MTDVTVREGIWLGACLAIGAAGALSLADHVNRYIDKHLPLFERDATDSPEARSGVNLRIDHGTGCHYLTTSTGGITPRLGPDGSQICE